MTTINEVAAAAGVSISTVSYALSGRRPVAVDTRRRIEAAIAELGYSPNAGARMLAAKRTQIFALTEPLRPDSHAPTHMSFVLATAVAARKQEYDILLLTEEDAQAGMRRVAGNRLVDAILVLDVAPDDPRVGLAREIATPTVFIGIPDDSDGLLCVDLDFERAAAVGVEALVAAGHGRLGLIGHPLISYDKSNFPPRVRSGFFGACEDAGATGAFEPAGAERATREDVRAAVIRLLDSGVTGLLLHCADDAHEQVLATLEERGLRVPEDVSVVSVGSSFDTAGLRIPLDSIPLEPAESCTQAVQLAVALLSEEPPAPGIRLIPPRYLPRGSVAPRTT